MNSKKERKKKRKKEGKILDWIDAEVAKNVKGKKNQKKKGEIRKEGRMNEWMNEQWIAENK